MTKIIGRTGALGIGIESTKGTPVAAAYWIPVQGYSFDDKIELVKNDSAMGQIFEFNDADITKLWAEGDYDGKLFLNSLGAELVALFGQSPSSAQRTTTGVYDHTYALLNSNDHKALTIGYNDAVQEISFPFGTIDSWSLEVAVDDYVKRTVSLISKKSASASHTPAFTNEIEFLPSHCSFKTATTAAGLGAASAINITNFKLDVKKNAEAIYNIGSNEPTDIINKQFNVTGSVELYFEDTTHRDIVMANTHKAMRIRMTDAATIIGSSGSHNPEFYIDLNDVVFDSYERNWSSNDPLAQTLNFEGVYSIADGAGISARLTNTVVSY